MYVQRCTELHGVARIWGGALHGVARSCTDLGGALHGVARSCTDLGGVLHGVARSCTDCVGRLHGVARSCTDCGGGSRSSVLFLLARCGFLKYLLISY
jgi:hypothetical protein